MADNVVFLKCPLNDMAHTAEWLQEAIKTGRVTSLVITGTTINEDGREAVFSCLHPTAATPHLLLMGLLEQMKITVSDYFENIVQVME